VLRRLGLEVLDRRTEGVVEVTLDLELPPDLVRLLGVAQVGGGDERFDGEGGHGQEPLEEDGGEAEANLRLFDQRRRVPDVPNALVPIREKVDEVDERDDAGDEHADALGVARVLRERPARERVADREDREDEADAHRRDQLVARVVAVGGNQACCC